MEAAPKLSQARRKEIRALHRKRERLKRQRMLVEGPRALEPLVYEHGGRSDTGSAAHALRYVVVAEQPPGTPQDPAVAAILEALQAADTAVYSAPANEFAALATTEAPQGLLAVVETAEPPPLVEWLRTEAAGEKTRWRNHCRLLVLDAVQDPGNVGTLVRSAAALGVAGVALTRGSAEPTNPKVIRASAGAFATLPIWSGLEPGQLRAALDAAGLSVWLAEPGGVSYRDVDIPARSALVLGAEVAGLAEVWRHPPEAGPTPVAVGIPQAPAPQSLNVAMAGTILLAHLAPAP